MALLTTKYILLSTYNLLLRTTYLADGREALLVEESVVAVVDEHLRGARAWASRREDDGTPLVGHLSTEVRSKCKCKYV